MTHKQRLFRRESVEESKEHTGHHDGGVKHRSRKRGFKLKNEIPWYFIIGILVGVVSGWLVLILFVNKFP